MEELLAVRTILCQEKILTLMEQNVICSATQDGYRILAINNHKYSVTMVPGIILTLARKLLMVSGESGGPGAPV